MKFITAIATFCLALASVVASTEIDERATAIERPAGSSITSVGVLGTGCPKGTATYVLDNKKGTLTVSYSNFTAKAGPNVSIIKNRAACSVTLGVNVPKGYTFSISSIDYKGSYQLDSKVNAIQQSVYYFQGQQQQATSRSTFHGPIPSKNYAWTAGFSGAQAVKSPCGANAIVNIISSVRIDNSADRKASGRISVKTQQGFGFHWDKC